MFSSAVKHVMLEALIRGVRARGPAATFNAYDMVECIFLLGEKGSIGRGKLGSELMLGPGAVRTLISRLKSKGYIRVDRNGCRLSPKGLSLYSELTKKIVYRGGFRCWDKTLGKECFLTCVRGVDPSSVSVVSLRDIAVKAGADGALILSYNAGEFYFAGENVSYEKTQPVEFWREIKTHFKFGDGDTLIVGFSGDKRSARDGALAAALSLIRV
ncbi:hypothetical protein B9Q04_09550 [Candidatus Marsarchaeota G2 archaeon BE_D]|jgi:hypothetical protein|uniref:Uncharacterized protein n=4 Tax=Candidatus Marsarchaeota group 2 TaxID=2203771 RepID=A0A2R6C9V8_9ARCH|nr:MAG: hypothetical protein B9Q06_00070 [Candidatus Marsarchaeota G2 archaeon ECH_B_2]PSN98164.1 MAG: hypothetical protein B9Q07_10450 [Candidatus Marsarchaeota G2 archaeon ECH_B_3]PSO03291.1 MAG: hypothetical protein B9Q05_00070 [Candidatus Marsarchaeota G2 archaeon ECH_B_1]PSO07687.1 MAG: hypothetical protein B9Q04_09550 [Candidatus Marsarchaeota G2 archaeon BE_D]